MSTEITTAFVQQYTANVLMLSQQQGSLLRSSVLEEPVKGTSAFFEQIGSAEAYLRTTRHADVQYVNMPHKRRRVTLATYEWSELIDEPDKVRMLIDPTSSYVKAAAWAMGRAMDDVIISAARGSAWTGATGSTEVTLPSSQKIAAGGTGLSLEKLLEAKEILDSADVPPDIPRFFWLTPAQVSDLLNLSQITSADYNSVRALVAGQVDTFLGFKFIVTNRLPKESTTRYCLAGLQTGIILGVGENPVGNVDKIPTKGYSTQVFYRMDIGATRMEEEQVVEIACTES